MTQTASSPAATAESRQSQTWVYFEGRVCQYKDAHLGLMTHALHYGTGCFEGIRAYWNADPGRLYVLKLQEHLERLRQSAAILRIEIAESSEELAEIIVDLLRRNQYREDVYIRPIAYKAGEEIGVRLHGIRDSLAVYMAPFGSYVDIEAGLRCMVSSWRRIDDNAAPARSKCTGIYINSALAKSEAMENGFDEAIMLTNEGHVSEGSAENIFLVRRGRLITPPLSDNILEGITRSTLIDMAREEMGLEVEERSIDRSELYVADEVLLCGTGAQLAPVVEIDRRRIGDGEPGPISLRLQSMYLDAARGRSVTFRDWLTPVD